MSLKPHEDIDSPTSSLKSAPPRPLQQRELEKLVAGLGQWVGVGKQVLTLNDGKRCVALLVPISPQERLLVPQVPLSSPVATAKEGASRERGVSIAIPQLAPELMRINSVRLSQYTVPDDVLRQASTDGHALLRSYAWWLAARAAEAGVCAAAPKELVRLARWPTLGTQVDRVRAMRACTVLSRNPFCPRDLAILTSLTPVDTSAFVTAGAILRFVEVTGETVPGRPDREGALAAAPPSHPLAGLFAGIRRRFSSGRA